MLDSPSNGNRRFFLTDSFQGTVDILKNVTFKLSPCVLMESDVTGYVKNGRVFRNYPIYFLVKAKKMSDGDSAAEAKEEAWCHAKELLVWLLHQQKQNPMDRNYTSVNLEDRLAIDTIGPFKDGWFAVTLQIERDEGINQCLDTKLYL